MKITHYSFGRITVDGRTYTSDVIIYPDRVDPSWWRKDGHSLSPEDLTGVISASPEVLIIGTGAYGAMQVPASTVGFIRAKGIEVHIAKTADAVDIFNHADKKRQVIACLHLTC